MIEECRGNDKTIPIRITVSLLDFDRLFTGQERQRAYGQHVGKRYDSLFSFTTCVLIWPEYFLRHSRIRRFAEACFAASVLSKRYTMMFVSRNTLPFI